MHSLKNKFKFLVIRIIAPGIIKALFFFVPSKKNTLLIIKNDGIGDYILFRNFLAFLKQSEKYRGYDIYLLGNLAYKDISAYLDKDSVDRFFWNTDGYFLKWKLLKLLVDLHRLRLNSVIYTNYSRKTQVDWIVKNLNAPNKIGVDGNTTNQSTQFKNKGNAYYTRLITVPGGATHEFERNKQLFEIIAEEKCHYNKPFINKQKLNIVYNNYIVIFIGARDRNRKWSNRNFSDLTKLIISNLNVNIIFAGGEDEIADGLMIQQDLAMKGVINKIGALSLIQLCELIGGAKLVICSDTVAVHIAAALSIPAVCISKGDLYKRFIPYPDHIENKINSLFPVAFKADAAAYELWSELNIDAVQLIDVYNAVVSTLQLHNLMPNAPSRPE
ncbi:glycosyltransferase family 9 protein [Mucilaginibacter glaciei]|uniref:ADP-heptose:LPS heptosyltransferase n=1 Tax=Mucilaginibacter glaciei TaxID=2772109 RepID=A0A926S3X7_9SPHI|nr:glycosyltransferase family 9 protein [Mucilaginibacter glaciei]MBD1394704.1 hypothetical protein [Mucilaginibacter glaciei]